MTEIFCPGDPRNLRRFCETVVASSCKEITTLTEDNFEDQLADFKQFLVLMQEVSGFYCGPGNQTAWKAKTFDTRNQDFSKVQI